jgi:hypothetical protein
LNLAKSRYIQGSNSILQIRLPTEESEEYEAFLKVTTEQGNSDRKDRKENKLAEPVYSKKRNLHHADDASVESELLRQFGVLSSSTVKTAERSFRKAVELCIDRMNTAEELAAHQNRFNSLHKIKKQ